jgi:asparaginyl-tRNA synthetase
MFCAKYCGVKFSVNVVSRRFLSVVTKSLSELSVAKPSRMKVKKLIDSNDTIVGQTVMVQGWVKTKRDQKQFAFVEMNDGSTITGIQTVIDCESPFFSVAQQLTTGCAAEVIGTVIVSPGKGQKYEIQATSVKLVGACPPDTYPLQKKRHSLELLREHAHLRGRTNIISAVARVRSALALATHQYFHSEGFVYFQSPLITASDCEGAGEMFRVTTLPLNQVSSIRQKTEGGTDFSKDFFGKPTFLTVSGQLSGEAYASALGDIYTFGPTFRAEKSLSSRHLAEFHMVEPEMAFCDLPRAMDSAEAYIKHVVKHVQQHCVSDMDFFARFTDKSVESRLQKVVSEPFTRLAYSDAVVLLQKEIAKNKSSWAYPEVVFGSDLQSEHERWLAEKHFGACVFVHHYPREIKSFYMRDSDEDARCVDSFDLLVPGIGELIGGSAREERLDVLEAKMHALNMRKADYDWYLDLRRYGSVPHAGYGLGFERLVCMVTGVENIRDAIGFPRYFGKADF